MSLDLRRFQFLLGTPCECQNVTYIDDQGAHVANIVCCKRCWEVGMMALQAEDSRQSAEVADRQLSFEVDGILEPTAPLSP